MRNGNYRHAGGRIHRAVRDAVHSGSFEGAGRAIDDCINEFAECGNEFLYNMRTHRRHACWQHGAGYTGGSREKGRRADGGGAYVPYAFSRRMPGSVSGIVCAVTGVCIGVPVMVSDIFVFVAGAINGISFGSFAAAACVLTLITCASAGLAARGIFLRRRARRFTRYREVIGGASFCMVESLALTAGENKERVRKDLKKMIASGACPNGHMDRKETCFMVDDETYEKYLEAEDAYEKREADERSRREKETENPQETELSSAIKEGNEYLRQIRAVNDMLPGEVISGKLDRLENVTARIFACVHKHPEKLPDIRRFIRYYMPTTLKLVKSYAEFESQPVQGENITKAKREIEQALDTVNKAFENLLDTLFADDVIDVSADISTLEMMLKQEGLTGSDFKREPGGGKPS